MKIVEDVSSVRLSLTDRVLCEPRAASRDLASLQHARDHDPSASADENPEDVGAKDVSWIGEMAEETPTSVGHQAGGDAVQCASEARAKWEGAGDEKTGDGKRRERT